VCLHNISLHQAIQQSSFDYCNRLIDYGFRLGKSQISQTVPEHRLFFTLSIPELRKQIMQHDDNVQQTTLQRFRSGWLHLSIDAGWYLMTPFLDFVLINRHTTHASYDSMLYEATKVTEATAAFHRTGTVTTLQSLHDKGRIV
jgi:hypothetical protein